MNPDKIVKVKLSDIVVDDLNVRKTNRDEKIDELAASIKEHGLMQPIVLMETRDVTKYKLLVGQRRYLAHKLLRKEVIDAIIVKELDNTEAILMSIAENMQRVELNYADKANAITNLYIQFGRSEKKVQKALGLSILTIRDYINVSEQATSKVQDLLRKRKVSKEDVKRVIKASRGDKKKMDSMIDRINELSNYEKNRLVEYSKEDPKKTVDELIEDAKKPKIEETVILTIPKHVREAVLKATHALSVDIESLALEALTDWLIRNNYLK